jgi:hypothetical protein
MGSKDDYLSPKKSRVQNDKTKQGKKDWGDLTVPSAHSVGLSVVMETGCRPGGGASRPRAPRGRLLSAGILILQRAIR